MVIKKTTTVVTKSFERGVLRKDASSRENDVSEFNHLFDDANQPSSSSVKGRNKKKSTTTTATTNNKDDIDDNEAIEFFSSQHVSSFASADIINDKNLHLSLSKQMEKEGLTKAFGMKRKLENDNEYDHGTESEDEQDEEDQDDEDMDENNDQLEKEFVESRGHRSFENQDIVRKLLPTKGADGTMKRVTEVIINPETKVEKLKGVEMHPKQILKEKEQERLKVQQQERQLKKQKMMPEVKEKDKKKKSKKKGDDDSDDGEMEDSESDSDSDDDGPENDVEELEYMEMSDNEEEEEAKDNGRKKPINEAERFLLSQQTLEETKVQLAQISSKIIENPEKNIALFNNLFAICLKQADMTIKKLTVLSMCALFKDIIPGYKINNQLHKEDKKDKDDKKQKLSKDMKLMRIYEGKLLKYYQNYLVLLEGTVENILAIQSKHRPPRPNAFFRTNQIEKGNYTSRDMSSMLFVVIKVAATLLVSKPHFNFKTNLVVLTARFTVYRDKSISAFCLQSITELFQNDLTGGSTSLEVVRCISNVAKATNYMMDPSVLRVFHSIHLSDAVEKVNPFGAASDNFGHRSQRGKKHFSNKERSDKRADKKLEKEMFEADAEYTVKEQKYLQTEILKSIFITYFRIIKQAPHSPALASVLEGLAKFAHLISVDFLGDLLAALAGLIGRDNITLGNALNATITAFKTVKQHGHTLNVDLKDYFSKVYSLLPQLVLPREQHNCLAAVNAFQGMLGERKQTAIDRVAAFIKRMATISTALPPHVALAFISLCKVLFVGHPRVQRLIENDNSFHSGEYNGETPDPDHCNPFSSTLWELTFFYNHWHPQFEPIIKRFLSFNETSAAQVHRDKSPAEIYQLYDNSKGGFNPPIQTPKEHPLENRLKKLNNQKTKNKREIEIFIIPTQTEPSNFLSSITSKAEEVEADKVSFNSYFEDIRDYERQMSLKKKLTHLQRVKAQVDKKLNEKELKLKQHQAQQQKQTTTTSTSASTAQKVAKTPAKPAPNAAPKPAPAKSASSKPAPAKTAAKAQATNKKK
ncbi:hypothetical protein SAMD00019534_031230 [Acytostelium subglobosum LB1]|uniref:hypothetical protein n=1 Tax=Acytostelium subglobosum LB1 TaxID=1410327 RepID=UPI000644DBBA|nr:hypothetical protein SAMD00019534_031230 [Acytostelium subglobosum LB1]GAM19948.1 hypothetical protein SAMD00019534_031230 [Acytostelium subglobosum LB1]|eukprot:XP_012756710.1 hypothetical protein SAMD00019534_031230 [Acytostelium subglobosum LB1]